MARKLEGAVALVTGASSGIGEATVRRLAAEGASVALIARRRERLEKLASSLSSDGGKGLVIEADITDRGQARGVSSRPSRSSGGWTFSSTTRALPWRGRSPTRRRRSGSGCSRSTCTRC